MEWVLDAQRAAAVEALGPIERVLVRAKRDRVLDMADAPPTRLWRGECG